jgi:hypothetical protein
VILDHRCAFREKAKAQLAPRMLDHDLLMMPVGEAEAARSQN